MVRTLWSKFRWKTVAETAKACRVSRESIRRIAARELKAKNKNYCRRGNGKTSLVLISRSEFNRLKACYLVP